MALSATARTLGISLAVHGIVATVVLLLAGKQLLKSTSEDDYVEVELLPPEPPPAVEPELEPVDEPEVAEEIPTEKRPERVPEKVEVVRTEEANPFQDEAHDEGAREAPSDAEAVPQATSGLTFRMTETVGSGSGLDYASQETGDMALPPSGAPGGKAGPADNSGARDVKVARDWQITTPADPLNDGAFKPRYPPLAKRQGREALVVVRLDIDASGQVVQAEVIEGPERHGFRRAALEYCRKLRFSPAMAGDNPVASRVDWRVHFYVRN